MAIAPGWSTRKRKAEQMQQVYTLHDRGLNYVIVSLFPSQLKGAHIMASGRGSARETTKAATDLNNPLSTSTGLLYLKQKRTNTQYREKTLQTLSSLAWRHPAQLHVVSPGWKTPLYRDAHFFSSGGGAPPVVGRPIKILK